MLPRRLARLVAFYCWAASASLVLSQSPPPAAIVIQDVSVVDVVKGVTEPHRRVVLRDGRIESIQAAAEAKPGDDATVVDGAGLFLIPGLIDAHVHDIEPFTFDRMLLAHGVTFVRDMGGMTRAGVELKEAFRTGKSDGPERMFAGAIVDGSPPIWAMISKVAVSPEEGREAVRTLQEGGVDFIKVYERLLPEVYAAIVDEARTRNIRVAGHVPALVTLEEAIKAGQATVEHLSGFARQIATWLDEPFTPDAQKFSAAMKFWPRLPEVDPAKIKATCAAIKAAGQAHVPTLVVIDRIGRMNDPKVSGDPRLDFVPPFIKGYWKGVNYQAFSKSARESFPFMKSLVRSLHEAGVVIVAGTDLANPFVIPGAGLHDELKLLQEAGLSPVDVLRSATVASAQALGVAKDFGSVEPGKAASLVLVRKDPLLDAANVGAIEAVFVRGKHFPRATLDRLLAEAKERAKPVDKPEEVPAAPPPADDWIPPGKILARGVLRVTFGGKPQGTETYVITEDDDGFHVATRTKPEGVLVYPSSMRIDAGKDYILKTATWIFEGSQKVVANYLLKDGKVSSEVTRDGVPVPSEKGPILQPFGIRGPAHASDFLIVHQLKLEPGGIKAIFNVDFGLAGPEWRQFRRQITRKPDESLTLPDGRTVVARVYDSKAKPMVGGELGTFWTDENGVVLKSTMRTGLGVTEVIVESSQ